MDRRWEGGLLVWVLQQLEQASPDEKVMIAEDNVLVLCSDTRLYIASEKVIPSALERVLGWDSAV